MGAGMTSVEWRFCSEPSRFYSTPARENLCMLELPVWLLIMNSGHVISQHLWLLLSAALSEVSIPRC